MENAILVIGAREEGGGGTYPSPKQRMPLSIRAAGSGCDAWGSGGGDGGWVADPARLRKVGSSAGLPNPIPPRVGGDGAMTVPCLRRDGKGEGGGGNGFGPPDDAILLWEHMRRTEQAKDDKNYCVVLFCDVT